MATNLRYGCVLAMLACMTTACSNDSLPEFSESDSRKILTLSPLVQAPPDTTNLADGNPAAIQLGQLLFVDSRLSGDGKFSCASCHDPAKGWADGRQVSVAAGTGTRNTPSLWNVAHNRWFFWDGRADSLWSQALKPIENPLEMAGSRLQVVRVLANDRTLLELYTKVFGSIPDFSDTVRFPVRGGPLSGDPKSLEAWWTMSGDDRKAVTDVFVNIGKAIAAFEATIASDETPFDRFADELRSGKRSSSAISASAQRGLGIFVGKGNCIVCHSGPTLSNKEFHDVRVPQLATLPHDEGRILGVPQLFEDEFVSAGFYSDDPEGLRAQKLYYLVNQDIFHGQFKTPSLRNVALTAPYMHQGQFATLREVVAYYSTLENSVDINHTTHVENLIVPLALTEQEIDDVVSFLESLTSDSASFAAPAR